MTKENNCILIFGGKYEEKKDRFEFNMDFSKAILRLNPEVIENGE